MPELKCEACNKLIGNVSENQKILNQEDVHFLCVECYIQRSGMP